MLNPFPHLLDYSFFVPTLLRTTAAVCLIFISQHLYRTRASIEEVRLPIVGKPRGWMVQASAAVTLITAFFLFVGLYTQWAAIVGTIIALKHTFGAKHYSAVIPFSRSTNILLAILCFSLLFLGAGALGFDIRL